MPPEKSPGAEAPGSFKSRKKAPQALGHAPFPWEEENRQLGPNTRPTASSNATLPK